MSNGINPNDPGRINAGKFNQNGSKNSQPDQEQQGNSPSSASLERTPVDPSQVMAFLSAQGSMNLNIEHVPVANSVLAFLAQVSPENHARLYQSFEDTFHSEFGIAPNPQLVQEALDDYLIGTPVIQK